MFKLQRYFSITSLLAFTVATLAFSYFYRQKALADLIVSGESKNVAITKSFSNFLWSEFQPFLLSASNLNDEQLRTHPETAQLRQAVLSQRQDLGVVKLKIMDLQGRTIFSTDNQQIGSDYSQSQGFKLARSGSISTKFSHRDTFESFDQIIENRSLISSYIPINQSGSNQIEGVFELYSDVTPLNKQLKQTQKTVTVAVTLGFSLLYLITLLIVRHADQIIQAQYLARQRVEESLRQSKSLAQNQAQELKQTLQELKQTQSQLIHSEKMSSLGQLVAGVAHEINNPANFIHGNIIYTQDLLKLLTLYQKYYPDPALEIQAEIEAIDLDYLTSDLVQLIASMKVGSERITSIVKSLRTFSRLDEALIKEVDIHESIDSTLMILGSRLKAQADNPEIKVIKDYGNLPLVECHASQLNQVFMNLLSNAIDAIEELPSNQSGQICIHTEAKPNNWLVVTISDNGMGISEAVAAKLFDPFFTTKSIGKGTGLGLAISYQIIVDGHGGKIWYDSTPQQGTKFVVEIPLSQPTDSLSDKHTQDLVIEFEKWQRHEAIATMP